MSDLREQLHELASDQPPVHVDPATYRRGRRQHARTLALRSGAAVLALLVGAGVLTQLRPTDEAAVPAGGLREAALPARVWTVPQRLVTDRLEGTWDARVGSDDLAVGRTALLTAAADDGSPPVAVSAIDGRYHPLTLPGHSPLSSLGGEFRSVSLSPDGRRLAYTWNPELGADRAAASGVRVVDLRTGRIRSFEDVGSPDVASTALAWSPSGRWLAYVRHVGTTNRRVTEDVVALDTRTDEVVGGSTSDPVPSSADEPGGLAVADDGTIAIASSDGVLLRPVGTRSRVLRIGHPVTSVAFDRDGLLAATSVAGELYLGDQRRLGAVPVRQSLGEARLAGWPAGGDPVLVRTPVDTTSGSDVLSVALDGAATVRTRFANVPSATTVSVATDLASRSSRAFAQPDWPLDRKRLGAWLGGGGLGLVAVAALVLAFRGRRRR